MSGEILKIPEEYLEEVISVIRIGILLIENTKEYHLSDETKRYLREWCSEEEKYLERLKYDGR